MVRALVALVACLAVACAGSPSEVGPVAVTTFAAANPSPSEVETFIDPMPDPPELTLLPDGDNFEPVIREIYDFRAWLFGHPNRDDLVSEIHHDVCPCHDLLKAELIELRVEDARVFGRNEFAELRLVDASPASRSFVVERVSVDLVRVDEQGVVVDSLDRGSDGRKLIQLTPGEDNRWRIQSIRAIKESP